MRNESIERKCPNCGTMTNQVCMDSKMRPGDKPEDPIRVVCPKCCDDPSHIQARVPDWR